MMNSVNKTARMAGLLYLIYTSHGHKLRFFKGLKPEGQE